MEIIYYRDPGSLAQLTEVLNEIVFPNGVSSVATSASMFEKFKSLIIIPTLTSLFTGESVKPLTNLTYWAEGIGRASRDTDQSAEFELTGLLSGLIVYYNAFREDLKRVLPKTNKHGGQAAYTLIDYAYPVIVIGVN